MQGVIPSPGPAPMAAKWWAKGALFNNAGGCSERKQLSVVEHTLICAVAMFAIVVVGAL